MTSEELQHILDELCLLPTETEWVEFKTNKADPEDIGRYISALANSAALCGKEKAWMVWGIKDETHQVIGTTFQPHKAKKSNEQLEPWLARMLSPRLDFAIHEVQYNGHQVVMFEIPRATTIPVRFENEEFIRIGSQRQKLREFPEKERALWALFSQISFEKGIAMTGCSEEDIFHLIDFPAYFNLTNQPLPDNRMGVVDKLIRENLIVARPGNHYDITNLGGMLFAKDLQQFERLSRKALRIIQYQGGNRLETYRERIGERGYAVGFENAVVYISAVLPQNEHIGQAFRRDVPMYPEIAVRELVANALIHQDFTMTGTGPMVEIFSDRIEITNPGKPLIDALRFMDEPPQSRNETLAALMRRMNICEERGSGVDKVVHSVELFQPTVICSISLSGRRGLSLCN